MVRHCSSTDTNSPLNTYTYTYHSFSTSTCPSTSLPQLQGHRLEQEAACVRLLRSKDVDSLCNGSVMGTIPLGSTVLIPKICNKSSTKSKHYFRNLSLHVRDSFRKHPANDPECLRRINGNIPHKQPGNMPETCRNNDGGSPEKSSILIFFFLGGKSGIWNFRGTSAETFQKNTEKSPEYLTVFF